MLNKDTPAIDIDLNFIPNGSFIGWLADKGLNKKVML